MMLSRLTALLLLSAAAWSAHAKDAAAAADYPAKPIRLIVGYSPGGSNDVIARLVAKRLQDSMGQPVVVENRPSTGAIVGAVVTARAEPDGYTLMIGASGPIAINPAVYKKLPYSPQDFVPVSLIATFPLVLTVKHDSGIRGLQDLVAYTRKYPERSNYSSSSSTFQMATEQLKEQTGIQAQHVPYKGSNDSMLAVASGEVTFSMLDPGPAAGALKGGLIRGLAVTSAERMPAYPGLPTLKEQGVDLEIGFWIGLFAPKGTPAAIVQRLEQEVAKAVGQPDAAKEMTRLGLTPTVNTSSEFTRQIDREIKAWTQLARQKNIVVE
ncbi:Bug family tripartite tricarboxylate transporter substrate binding protein [Bordetella petrii]|uniref:Bug family tripartite tricarboxylate transporter substrate binding protein n=1 Tax=Bordetella petrii TaxID=94624 RepID=UPI001A957F74|nr:tripartite tricarboxylate transporter substrate binding protein [Bordetella petrii]MBO1110863.1 tripartite tricarboxylate transporter substrate binding protein [Bordetella petrii]